MIPCQKAALKINDKIIQRYNIEHDLAVLEAAAKDSGSAKFMNDRIKISIENKVIIDNYLMDSVLVDSVNSLQVYGLSVHLLNTTLEEPGLYVTKELCNHTISKSLSSIKSYLNLALELLCFRDYCTSKSKAKNEHLVKQENQKKKNSRSTIR